jgi:hypothetical protein
MADQIHNTPTAVALGLEPSRPTLEISFISRKKYNTKIFSLTSLSWKISKKPQDRPKKSEKMNAL